MSGSGEPGTTYLYESFRARVVLAALPILVMGSLAAAGQGTIRVIAMICVVVLVLDELIRLRRPVAKLTPTMIVVTGMRPQEVAWYRIAGISTMTRLGSSRIVLEIDNGDRVVMSGPSGNVFGRAHFEATLEQVRREWQQRRGTSRPAAPQPDAQ